MRILAEKEAENFLEKKKFPIVKRVIIKRKEQLKKIRIKFPWIMKVSSRKIIHKARVGGVITKIKNLKQAENAFKKLSKIKYFEAAMIQETAKGEELIIGLKKTPEFNTVIMFGRGGSEVEKERDVSFRVIPINKKDVEEMIKEIKFYKQLREKTNLKQIEKSMLKISNLANRYKKISELDLNPIMVNKKQAIIADARIVFDD